MGLKAGVHGPNMEGYLTQKQESRAAFQALIWQKQEETHILISFIIEVGCKELGPGTNEDIGGVKWKHIENLINETW